MTENRLFPCYFQIIVIYSWIPWNLSFRYIHCTGQFTPKMKANAEPHLLSSLVWIDSGVVVWQHRLESFFHEMICNGMTSFMEFIQCTSHYIQVPTLHFQAQKRHRNTTKLLQTFLYTPCVIRRYSIQHSMK